MTPLTVLGSLRWPIVHRVINERQPSTILELGCGQGTFGERMSRLAAYLGVEPDPTSYETARQRIEKQGGRVLLGDQTALPPGARYDLVCAFEVIEHIEEDAAQLAEWLRFVRPGGSIVLSVPAFQHQFGPYDESVGHYRRYSPEQMRRLLSDAGLDQIVTYLYGWPLGNAVNFVHNRLAGRKRDQFADMPIQDRTHASGRTLRLHGWLGTVASAATLPFRSMYKIAPNRGIGLVAAARRPA